MLSDKALQTLKPTTDCPPREENAKDRVRGRGHAGKSCRIYKDHGDNVNIIGISFCLFALVLLGVASSLRAPQAASIISQMFRTVI